MSAWVWILGAGATAFFVCPLHKLCLHIHIYNTDSNGQGRAALVALRRSGGGAGALGRSYYKGGFEPKMTRREAALILELPYDEPPYESDPSAYFGVLTTTQRKRHYQGTSAQEAPLSHAFEPPRSRRQPLPGHQSQRSKRTAGEGG